jgi:predicted  nucleic acid-binding Zn-ribbon protein
MPGNGKKVAAESTIASCVENLRVGREGVYQIDLESFFRGNPLVIKVRDGVYHIDLSPLPRL